MVERRRGPLTGVWIVFCVCVGALLLLVFTQSGNEERISKPAEPSPESQRPPEMSATQIVRDYEANEVAADQMYKGRQVFVVGRVGEIKKDILDNPYITLDEDEVGFKGVQAFFDADAIGQLSGLRRGEVVGVIGTCDGLMMHVMIKGCRLVPVAPGPAQ